MKISVVCLQFVTITIVSSRHWFSKEKPSPSLILTHVLFRHGNRTPEFSELYPKDPYLNYTYFPFGRGQLTNEGKRREYATGKSLRDRYDTFLGTNYYPEVVDSVSTNYNRTKMSLLLVLAGLFPPKGEEVWNILLNWQPIPYNYLERPLDKVLLGTQCKNYLRKYDEVVNSPKIQAEYDNYRDVFSYVSQNSGLNVTQFKDIYTLYFGLSTEEEWGWRLPHWTRKVWPDTITNISVKEYYVATANTDLKRMASGYHIKKIINDTNKKIKIGEEKLGTKMYLYSAHENNLAHLMILLDIKVDHVPAYGSYIAFEIHKTNQTYGVKIYYRNYHEDKIKLLKLPACDELCPWGKFQTLMEEYIPSDELCDS